MQWFMAKVSPRRRDRSRWHGRPWAARAVRLLVLLVPFGASLLAGALADRALPPWGHAAPVLVLRFVVVAAVATAALLMADRLARRALPLAALLAMTMAFPDCAPSRYKVARRSAGVRNLEERVRHARDHGVDPDPTAAAEEILALVAALGSHDRRTRGHSERTHLLTDVLADELSLSQDDRDRLRWASLVHDIGKLEVSGETLNHPGRPDEAQWAELRAHPAHGARICEPLRDWLGDWYDAIGDHHERWDGTGYPTGKAGTGISYAGRIVAVADAYEVITAARPYKRASSPEAARRELVRCAGSHFDPAMVRAFLNISLGRLRLIAGPLSIVAQAPVLERAGVVLHRVPDALRLALGAGAVIAATATAGLLPGLAPADAVDRADDVADGRVTTAGQDLTAVVPPGTDPTGSWGGSDEAGSPGEGGGSSSAAPPDGEAASGLGGVGGRPDGAPPPDDDDAAGQEALPGASPVTGSTSVSTPQGEPVTVGLGRLVHDPDGDLDEGSLTISAQGSAGTATPSGRLRVTYAPAPALTGPDFFTYRVCDRGGRCASAAVGVEILPRPTPPEPVPEDPVQDTGGAGEVDVPEDASQVERPDAVVRPPADVVDTPADDPADRPADDTADRPSDDGLDGVVDETTDVVDGVVDDTTDVVDGVVDDTTDVVDGVVDDTTDVVDGVVDDTTDVVDAIGGDVVDDVTDGLDGVVDDTTDVVDDVVDDTTDVVDDVLGLFGATATSGDPSAEWPGPLRAVITQPAVARRRQATCRRKGTAHRD